MSTNDFVEHLRTAASVKYYLYIVDYIISQSFERVFVKHMTTFFAFCGSEVHSLLMLFPKESIKIKKVSNFKALFDTCAKLTHMSRNKK